jgi:hypothetical protein
MKSSHESENSNLDKELALITNSRFYNFELQVVVAGLIQGDG